MQYLSDAGVGYAFAADGGHDAVVECLKNVLNDGFGCYHLAQLMSFDGCYCHCFVADMQLLHYL